MKKIALSKQGKHKGKYFALVDDEDYDWLNQWRWSVAKDRNTYYVVRRSGDGKIRMHRFIMNVTKKNLDVDHRDLNGLNNQKGNLRSCTRSQNCKNRTGLGGSSKYKGVCWDNERSKWLVSICTKGKRHRLGRFDNETEAATAYNKAAKKYHKEFARLNQV